MTYSASLYIGAGAAACAELHASIFPSDKSHEFSAVHCDNLMELLTTPDLCLAFVFSESRASQLALFVCLCVHSADSLIFRQLFFFFRRVLQRCWHTSNNGELDSRGGRRSGLIWFFATTVHMLSECDVESHLLLPPLDTNDAC